MLAPIRIIPLSPAPDGIIGQLIHPLRSVYGTDVDVMPPLTGITERAFDDSRGQHNSTEIIAELLRCVPHDHGKIIGITSADLFIPVLTYVFGEAQLDGPAAVVSTYRLDEAVYGFPPNEPLFFERALKEMVHELGHTYGLLHCRDFSCAMHASTTAEDIDLKGAVLCPACRSRLGLS